MRNRLPLITFAAIIAGASLAACGPVDSNEDAKTEFTFVNYGGDMMTAAEKGWLDPFSKRIDVMYKTDEPTELPKIQAMVKSGNVNWDAVYIDVLSGGAYCGKLFEKRDADINMDHLNPKYVTDDCGVPVVAQAVGLVYNKKQFGDRPPTSITDFMDTKKYPGKRMIYNYGSGSFEPLLAADGVDPEEIYPLDYDRAGNAIDELGDDLVLNGTLAKQVQAQIDGDFAMCLCYIGRSAVAAEEGADIGVVWDVVTTAWDGVYITKGSDSSDVVSEFQEMLADPEGQSGIYQYVAYAPTIKDNEQVNIDRPKEWSDFLLDENRDKIDEEIPKDVEWSEKNRNEMFDAWTRVTGG